DREHGKSYQASERVFQASLDAYRRSLTWVMDHRPTALAFSALILLGTMVLWMAIPKGFIPSEDIDQITGTTETPEGTSYESMVQHQRQVAALVAKDPNVDGFMSSVGGGGGVGNQGRLFIRLKPRRDRQLSADQVIRSLS